MAVTRITYKDENKGFYIHEDFIQLASLYIYKELIKPVLYNDFTDKAELVSDHEDINNGLQSGYLTLGWEDTLINSNDEQLMILLLQNVITYLQTKGRYIRIAELKSLPTTDGHWLSTMQTPFPTNELIRILNALIQLIDNTWQPSDYNMEISLE